MSLTSIKIGEVEVKQEKSAKLLGINFNDKLNWNDHIQGTGGVVSALNSRLYMVNKLKSHVGKKISY